LGPLKFLLNWIGDVEIGTKFHGECYNHDFTLVAKNDIPLLVFLGVKLHQDN
jgi:hypothetical protein